MLMDIDFLWHLICWFLFAGLLLPIFSKLIAEKSVISVSWFF